MLGHTASHKPTTPIDHPTLGSPRPHSTRILSHTYIHPLPVTPQFTHIWTHTHKLPWVTPSHNTKTHVSPAPGSSKHLEHIPVSHSHVSPAPFPTIEVQAMDGGDL